MSTRLFSLFLLTTLFACASTQESDSPPGGFSDPDSPIAKARLQSRVENIKYQRGVTLIANLERIAAYRESAIPVCLEGLESEDAMTRMGCAWVLGRIGNTKTVPALEKLLDDEVAFVRYEVASQLGTMGAKSGYGPLVEGLTNERIEYRYKCIEALQDLTGHTFGYSHNAAPEARNAAVQKWQEWLEDVTGEEL